MELVCVYIPYILLLYCSLIIATKLKFNQAYPLMICIMFIFAALRFDVGWDYMGYYDAIVMDTEERINSFELFEYFFVRLSQFLNFPQFFFIINSFLTLFFLSLAIKRLSINPKFSLFLYLTIPVFFLHFLSTVRYHLALSMILFAFSYLKRKQIIHFLLLAIVTLGVHESSLITIPIFLLLYYFRIGYICNVLLFVLSFFISSFFLDYILILNTNLSLLSKLIMYASNTGNDSFNVLPLIFCGINIMNFLLYAKFKKSLEHDVLEYISLYNIGCVLMNIFSFQETLSTRISRFFLVFLILLLPFYVKIYSNVSARKVVSFFIYCGASLFYFMQLYIAAYSFANGDLKNQYIPYRLFFL